jgi:hypothetical protein
MCAGIKVAHASGREVMVDPVSSVPPHQTNKQTKSYSYHKSEKSGLFLTWWNFREVHADFESSELLFEIRSPEKGRRTS